MKKTARIIGTADVESLSVFKKRAKRIIKEFCLKPDISTALIFKVENAQTEAEVSRILKEARDYI